MRKLKVYIPIWEQDPRRSQNPYVATLCEAMSEQDENIAFAYDKELLWENDCLSFDIMHVMWPHVFAYIPINTFVSRISQLKQNGVKIISTCHNITPHSKSDIEKSYYDAVYSMSDIIIHLGEFSKRMIAATYPRSKHIVIPHHIYDNLYNDIHTQEESRRFLNLPSVWKTYVLCIGSFRNKAEIALIQNLAKKLIRERVAILAPSLRMKPHLTCHWRSLLSTICWYLKKIVQPNLIVSGEYVGNHDLPYYFAASSIVLIQRIETLNSGNLPLAFRMGKAVAGPNVGNVGELLAITGNPAFDPYNIYSVEKAVKQAINAEELGKKNKEYAYNNWNVDIIAKRTLAVYRTF